MHPFLRWNLIIGLLVISLFASAFMVLEAGNFYQRLYPGGMGLLPLGFVAAGLNEVFMSIMAGARLQTKSGKGHPVNYLFRFLMVLLFLTTVGGASFNLVFDKIVLLQGQSNNQEVISILRSQLADHETSLQAFVAQNQRINSAITVRSQRETKQKLIEALKEKQSVTTLWFEVAFVILLRFGVQMANLACVWLAGWLYREGKTPKPVVAAPVAPGSLTPVGLCRVSLPYRQALQNSALALASLQPLPLPVGTGETPSLAAVPPAPATQASLPLTQETSLPLPPATPHPKPRPEPRAAKVAPALPQLPEATTPREPRLPVPPPALPPVAAIPAAPAAQATAPKEPRRPAPAPQQVAVAPAPAEPATPKTKVMPLAPKLEERRQRETEEEEEKIALQQEIRQLLSKRNPGVSLYQFAQALGLDARLLEELQSYRCNLAGIRFEQMELALRRIQSLYEEQSAIS